MTKKYLLFIFLISLFTSAYGQKTEFSLSFSSGLFNYSGSNAVRHASITSLGDNIGYVDNPFGALSGLSYGLTGNLKRIYKDGWLLGLDLGFERLRSEEFIDKVYPTVAFTPISVNTLNGKTTLQNDFINIFPFLGHRFKLGGLTSDISLGTDIAIPTQTKENGKVTTIYGNVYTTKATTAQSLLDIRPRIQFGLRYHREGIYIGYSYGLKNYSPGLIGDAVYNSYARYLRFGLSHTF